MHIKIDKEIKLETLGLCDECDFLGGEYIIHCYADYHPRIDHKDIIHRDPKCIEENGE